LSATTIHPIEVSYDETPRKRKVPTNVHEYARYLNVSSDGCSTTRDVDARNQMLKSVVRAHENGWLKS